MLEALVREESLQEKEEKLLCGFRCIYLDSDFFFFSVSVS